LKRIAVLAALLAALLAPALAAPAAHASTGTLGDRILNTAETRAGDWYSWGGSGPYVFDCSGLAYWAARQHGISIPRTTYDMLAGSAHLYRIPLSWARRGDLLFYGSGHVEFDTAWYHTSFGAHHSGTRVSWVRWSSYYQPTMAMRFR
jgi:cell wall-associated NlpC family hydrolase